MQNEDTASFSQKHGLWLWCLVSMTCTPRVGWEVLQSSFCHTGSLSTSETPDFQRKYNNKFSIYHQVKTDKTWAFHLLI